MAFGGEKGSGLVLSSRLVYDPTTGPVLPPIVPAAFTFVNPPPDGVRRRKNPSPILPSSFVFAIPVDDFGWQVHDQATLSKKRKVLADNLVFLPAPAAPPTITSTLSSTSSGNTVFSSRMVYDLTTAPIFLPAAVVSTPSAFGYPPDEGQKKRAPRLVLQGIEGSVGPPSTATPSEYGYQPGEGQGKRKPRPLPENVEWPAVLPPSAVAAIAFGYQAADSPRGKPVRRVSEAFATFVSPPPVIPTPPIPVVPPQGRFLKNEIRRITSLQRG